MNAAGRAERDASVLRLFMAGATYAQIAAAVKMTQRRVDQIVKRELSNAAQRRTLLSDEALAIHTERTERLFQAHWGKALNGDHRSADICRKLLVDNARLSGFYADRLPDLPAPTGPLERDDDEAEPGPQDELSKLRGLRQA